MGEEAALRQALKDRTPCAQRSIPTSGEGPHSKKGQSEKAEASLGLRLIRSSKRGDVRFVLKGTEETQRKVKHSNLFVRERRKKASLPPISSLARERKRDICEHKAQGA